ncbi:MAG: HAMP domain-containing protein [Spirochaetes bacterium]|nr:MAG: HAMP domain-containing protein [Spirochaetota bacterium]
MRGTKICGIVRGSLFPARGDGHAVNFGKGIQGGAGGRPRFEDAIFLLGIFAFAALLILGLFPKNAAGPEEGKSVYPFLMMAVPAIVAVYFIIISFRRRLSERSAAPVSGIRFKIALAFVFVAILPSLPIILISNNIFSHALNELIAEKTAQSLDESLRMARDVLAQKNADMQAEIATLEHVMAAGMLPSAAQGSRDAIDGMFAIRGYDVGYFKILEAGDLGNIVSDTGSMKHADISDSVLKLLRAVRVDQGRKVYSISVGAQSVLLGMLVRGQHVIALACVIPADVYARISLFEESVGRYAQSEYLKPYFETGVGVFLLVLSIVIILLSIGVSLVLSRNITRPVLALEEAARAVASGRFDIELRRDSQDELSLLFDSFNKMVRQLEESRTVMFHTQKLEAWRDMARKLVHEIKNPLTPIRLSAERIQKRYSENHPEIGSIVMTGTDTIIEEVKVLMNMLSEFTRFARLPEINPVLEDLNPAVEACINFFHGSEGVRFHLDLAQGIPRLLLDKGLIRQALTNVVQNSIDALGGTGNVYIRTWREDGPAGARAFVSVRDDGPGIKPGDLEKIFEPTFSTKAHGTGLGLTIVEKIILEHRGKVTCRSKTGAGTEFVFELPIP